ncbi:MAG TPA: glycosyltransferase family A protein [Rubricoccaceae bacterium]|jgi:glycosyltransferase involved in cell wall biosynthesis
MTSVVVPVFNGVHVLDTCVPAALALRGVDEWIWVDDGSTDDTASVLARLLAGEPCASTVTHDANRGRAASRNTGVRSAAGDVLVFLDADVAPAPDLAERFAAALAGGATATVARLVPAEPLAADPYGEYLRRARRGVPPEAQPGDVLPWRLFVTAACAVSRSAFEAAGGFDERIVYGEDLALACRLAARAPAGLVASGAVATISDTSTLERALANTAAFGRGLPAMGERCPGLVRLAGLERVLAPGLRHALAASPTLGAVVRRLATIVPRPLQPVAVRYLLGHTLVRAHDDARLHSRPGR